MNMTKRLNKIETQLTINKEADCELEMTVGLTEDMETEASYAKICPDGQREQIKHSEAQRLMGRDDEISVQIVD